MKDIFLCFSPFGIYFTTNPTFNPFSYYHNPRVEEEDGFKTIISKALGGTQYVWGQSIVHRGGIANVVTVKTHLE